MAETLKARGFFKQQLLSTFSSGRKIYKGISLLTKEIVLIQELSFERTLQAQIFYQEMKMMQTVTHPAAIRILACLLSASTCYIIQEFLPASLESDHNQWTESALVEFLSRYLELFVEAMNRGVFYRNISPSCFRKAAQDYHFGELSGYYYLKPPVVYQSPAVLQYLTASEDDLGSPLPFHNPYKSEVYSLGMVVLGFVLNGPLPDINPEETHNTTSISQLINEIQYSDQLKSTLFRMLDSNELTRFDPLQVLLYLKGELDMSNTDLFHAKHHSQMAVIEVRMQSQSSTTTNKKKYTVLSCVCCLVPIRIGTDTDIGEIQVLQMMRCPGKNHLFCGVECMMKFAVIQTRGRLEDVEQLTCPICQYHLPAELREKIRSNWENACYTTLTHSTSLSSESPSISLEPKLSLDFDHINTTETSSPSTLTFSQTEVLFSMDVTRQERFRGSATPEATPERKSITLIDFPTDCCKCGHQISLDLNAIMTAENPPVFLYCALTEHAFCSKECLKEFAESCMHGFDYDLNQVKCPKCGMEVDSELVVDAFGGLESFDRLRRLGNGEDGRCLRCDVARGTEQACGHVMCEPCRDSQGSEGRPNCPLCKSTPHPASISDYSTCLIPES